MSLHRNNSCANYIASVSQDDFCTGPLLSSRLSALRSTLCLTQHECLIVNRHPDTSAKTLSYPYPLSSSLIAHIIHQLKYKATKLQYALGWAVTHTSSELHYYLPFGLLTNWFCCSCLITSIEYV